MEYYRAHVLVCGGTGCSSSGSGTIEEMFKTALVEKGLEKEVQVVRTGCFGLCEAGPICIVYPEGSFYSHVKKEDVDRIVEEHLLKGRIVHDLLYVDKLEAHSDVETSINNVTFYKKQKTRCT